MLGIALDVWVVKGSTEHFLLVKYSCCIWFIFGYHFIGFIFIDVCISCWYILIMPILVELLVWSGNLANVHI